MDFETDLPPAVKAWFVQMHQQATPAAGDTQILFQVEAAYYTVTIHRDDRMYQAARAFKPPEPIAPGTEAVAKEEAA